MDWQLGRNTFMNKYNNFWKAVANNDYEGMRKESRTTWKDKKGLSGKVLGMFFFVS